MLISAECFTLSLSPKGHNSHSVNLNQEGYVSVGKANEHDFLGIYDVLFIFCFIYYPCPHQRNPWRDHCDHGPWDFLLCTAPNNASFTKHNMVGCFMVKVAWP